VCARESVQIEFLADQKRKLLFRAISEEVLVLFEVFNPGTYIWFSIKQSNVHFHALSARADDVGGHLTGFLHKDLAKNPLVETDEVFFLLVVGSCFELLEIMKVQTVLSVGGRNPRHGIS